ncbi:MAG: hypothetical protein ACR2HV_08930 [Acidimicrobiales bacterium]
MPTRVPDGLTLCSAFDSQSAEQYGDGAVMAIWGDRSLPDPWAGPLVGLSASDVHDELPVHDRAEPVMVQGLAGYVAPMPLFQAVSSEEWGHVVSWRDIAGRVIEAAVRGADAAGALRIADVVTVTSGKAALPTDALGPQTARIYDRTPIAPFGALDGTTWGLFYRSGGFPETAGEPARLLTLGGLARTAADLQPLRFSALTTEPTTVRGRPGLLYAAFDESTGPFGVVWEESPGLVAQVVGLGLDRAAVIAAAESLEPVDDQAWQALQGDAKGDDCR